MGQKIQDKLLRRILKKGEGWVFAPANFSDLGSRTSIDKSLARLLKAGTIRRIARGLYDYPKVHPELGELSPAVESIAAALKSKDATRIQSSGAHAAHLLGLTEQIPVKIVFLTDGAKRQVQVNNRQILLKPTTPKNMATAGTIGGTVYQALKWLGKEHVDETVLRKLQASLSEEEKKQLLDDLALVPAWVADCFREIGKPAARQKDGYEKFIRLPRKERQTYCMEAEARCGLLAASIEKDFWVCWSLRELFRLPEVGQHLTFKGGTSLSKGWNLIKRFSEDIDLIVDKEPLGFGGDNSPETAPSNKQKKKRKEAMKQACQSFVQRQLRPLFEIVLNKRLGNGQASDWSLLPDPDDRDGQTLLFKYPSAFPETSNAYLRREVKIEMGARSDNWPARRREIEPYLAQTFPKLFPDSTFKVQILQPERTFWEKATLLHEEHQRPPEKKRKARMSRHFYDLWAMIEAGVGEKAIGDPDLFNRVVEHRQFFFPYSWVDNSTLVRGSLRMAPPKDQVSDWESDYRAMKDPMFFEDAPSFDEILSAVRDFEAKFNSV